VRVLIIGGGIAGPAAALALAKAGIASVVYEAHPRSGEDIGAFLTLAGNGMFALAQIDAADAVAAVGFELTSLRLVDARGREVASRPLAGHERPLTCFRCLRRAELGAVLQREAARRGITIEHGRRLTSITDDGDQVTARFGDGTSAVGDLLVGADGLRSPVRSFVDPAGRPVTYAGQRVFYGYTTAASAVAAPPGTIEMIRGATAFGHATSPGGETSWFARETAPALAPTALAPTASAAWREHLVELLRGDDTPAGAIVAATGDHVMATNAWHLAPGGRWRTAATVLVGDAAHAASPATGQGASMALEDAVVLAKALRDTPTTDRALAAYESIRRPRVEANMAASAAMTASSTRSGAHPPAAPPISGDERPAGPTDDEVARQVDWALPLVTPPPDGTA
jgi:2-polyprenyl-6-methoxyphenol hydroxylase-like FAD-dependent oxidoreductase